MHTPMHVALYVSSFGPGGAEYVTVMIANGLAERGHRVDLLTCDSKGPLINRVDRSIRIYRLEAFGELRARISCLRADPSDWLAMLRPYLVAFKASPTVSFLPSVARFLRKEKPDALLSAAPHLNIEAVLAKRLSGTKTRMVLSEHVNFSHNKPDSMAWRRRYILPLMRRIYPKADAVVAVSRGVAEDLASNLGVLSAHITTIANPVIPRDFADRAAAPLSHRWFNGDNTVPVVLSVGRPSPQKDFPTLIRAFAKVHRRRPVRLVIVGGAVRLEKTAEKQRELVQLAEELGVAQHVDLVGYQPNPIAYMSRASLFVLSSRYEGLPTVLIEALAAGCPIVSTDCPSGPAEILEGGKFGRLVPVADVDALAETICKALDTPTDREPLMRQAATFDYEASISKYERILAGKPL